MYTRSRLSGFSLIELVMVMVIVGILAATAVPRFVARKSYDARGFFDQSIGMLRYAQKLAIAQRRDVYVNVVAASGTICLTYVSDPSCTNVASAVINPADQARFLRSAPSGSSIATTTSFAFTALGQPKPNVAVTISQTGDGVVRTVTVEKETGYVH